MKAAAGKITAEVTIVTAVLVDLLVEAGHPVLPVKLTAIRAWREV